MARLKFALKMLYARFDSKRSPCPYCSSYLYSFIQRKKLLIQVRKCRACGLIYRWPIDDLGKSYNFYKYGYKEHKITLPSLETLEMLLQKKFKCTEWDKTHRIDFMRHLIECRGKLLDFGCSWGYSTYQYMSMGFDVWGLDISRKRVEFGRINLGLNLCSGWEELENTYFDVIIADHTLEHLYNFRETLEEFKMHSKVGSKLIIFVPNGNCSNGRRQDLRPLIGEAHTMVFTMEWFLKNLPRHHFHPRFFTSSGEAIPSEKYLVDKPEIALVATRVEH